MNPTLPFEIITFILMMLPVETLVRFQCVCRAWKDLITDPKFIKEHFQIQASKGNNYLLYVPLDHTIDRAFRLLSDETFEQALEVPILDELEDVRFTLVSSCNGLLCLSTENDTIYLLNPSIRKFIAVHPPPISYVGPSQQINITFALGFGYYDVTNDYKVVAIASPLDEDTIPSFHYGDMINRIQVFSMTTSSWKNIIVDYFPWGMIDSKSEAFLNESIHWKAVYRDSIEDISVVIAFHMGQEVFSQIDLPIYQVEGDRLVEHIGVFKGDLALFYFRLIDHDPWYESCNLWVMKEYGVVSSWTKLYSIMLDIRAFTSIAFTKKDEIIFEDDDHQLNVWHPDSNAIRVIGVEDQGCLNFVPYVGSLVMLD